MLIGALGDPAKIGAALADPTPDAPWPRRSGRITETLVAATPLIFAGLGGRDLVPDRRVQHRRRGPVRPRRVRRRRRRRSPSRTSRRRSSSSCRRIAGIVTGAAWGFIPGFLKARTGAHEVITTIMLNYVAVADRPVRRCARTSCGRPGQLGADLEGPVGLRAHPADPRPARRIRLHWGFVVALLMAVVVSWFLFKTTKGFELRAAGFNLTRRPLRGHERRRLDHPRDVAVRAPSPGSAARWRCSGTVPQMSNDISSGYGFNAIALALLAGNRPGGIVAAVAPVRRPAHRRRVDAGQDRHPARPAVLHPGARDHVRGGARPHPGPVPVRSHANAAEAGAARRGRGCGMTAAATHRRAVTVEVSAAERKRPARARRIRGRHPRRPRRSSPSSSPSARLDDAGHLLVLGRRSRAGRALTITTTVGLLWILTGVVTGHHRHPRSSGRGASFRWRRCARARAAVLGRHRARRDARRQAGEPDGRPRRHARRSRPRSRWARSRASSPSAAASPTSRSRASCSIGACVASVAASMAMLVAGRGREPDRRRPRRHRSRPAIAGALVSLLLAWLGIRWKVDQIIAGIVINIGALGITNFLYLRVLSKNTQLQHAADGRVDQDPGALGDPGAGPDPVLGHAVPVLHAGR